MSDFIGIGLFTGVMLLMIWYVWAGAREEGRYAVEHYGTNTTAPTGEDRRFNPRWCPNCDAINRFESGNLRFCVNCTAK